MTGRCNAAEARTFTTALPGAASGLDRVGLSANAAVSKAACPSQECPISPMELQWTPTFPYVAHVPARRGGTWMLIVRPAADPSRWSWSVQHSLDEQLREGGTTGSPNFSKEQAERAVAHMDAAHPADPGIAPGPE